MYGKHVRDILSSIAVYYKKDAGTYWDSITPCSIKSKPNTFGQYYLNFTAKAFYPGDFDDNGIPLYYGYYQPVVICQYALGLYELLQKDNQDKLIKQKFLKQADWLSKNCDVNNDVAVWVFKNRVAGYNIEAPWISALAQGEAISVLLRAYSISGKEIYLETAEKALSVFTLEVKNGGIVNYFSNFKIFEEYPSQKTNFVLNGFVFSLFGLFDFSFFNNNLANKLIKDGIATLDNLLYLFDTGFWTQYNLYYHPKTYLASYKYHILHIELLKALYYLTDNKTFLFYSEKWQKYSDNFLIKTYALIKKIISFNIVPE
jgi:hypothetical protein